MTSEALTIQHYERKQHRQVEAVIVCELCDIFCHMRASSDEGASQSSLDSQTSFDQNIVNVELKLKILGSSGSSRNPSINPYSQHDSILLHQPGGPKDQIVGSKAKVPPGSFHQELPGQFPNIAATVIIRSA